MQGLIDIEKILAENPKVDEGQLKEGLELYDELERSDSTSRHAEAPRPVERRVRVLERLPENDPKVTNLRR